MVTRSARPRRRAREGRRAAALAAAWAALLSGCGGGVVPYEGGLLLEPGLEGPPEEQEIDAAVRERVGVWMGMPSLVAEERLQEATGARYGRVPPSSGVSSFATAETYYYLYRALGPKGSGEDRICGLRVRWREPPGPGSLHAAVSAALQPERSWRSERRAVLLTERSLAWVDPGACPERAPDPRR